MHAYTPRRITRCIDPDSDTDPDPDFPRSARTRTRPRTPVREIQGDHAMISRHSHPRVRERVPLRWFPGLDPKEGRTTHWRFGGRGTIGLGDR
ncbi:MAG: hypothetical protein ACOX52_24230 [Verrucomicrobiota bacterium]